MRNGVVDKQTVDGLTILVLAGELDLSAVSALRRELISSAAETLDIVIDLRRVTFMDCSTIGAFVMLNNHVRANGGSLQLTRVAPGQLRLLTLCQLIRALRVRDTLQGATAAAHGSHDRQYVSQDRNRHPRWGEAPRLVLRLCRSWAASGRSLGPRVRTVHPHE